MQKLLGFLSLSLVCCVLFSAVGCPSKDKDKPSDTTKVTKDGKSLSVTASHPKVEQGKSADVDVTIERKGFDDEVVLKVEAPANVTVTPMELKFAKNETKGKLKVDAAAAADAKDHEIKLHATAPDAVKDAKATATVTVTKKG